MNKLPEKWYIKVTKDNADIIDKWKSTTEWKDNAQNWKYVDYRGVGNGSDALPDGYIEITFKQFKQFVLKEPIMEKKIIGYKLKESAKQYRLAACKIANISDGGLEIDPERKHTSFLSNTSTENYLREAKVLDLWFEPVYEEEYKVGDWVLLSNDADGWGSERHINNQIVQIKEIKTLWGDNILKIFFTFKGTNESTAYKEIVREATHEEVKAVQIPDITINGYKAVFFDKYVKFGCAEISNELFIDLYKIIKVNYATYGKKNVESVTIGTGVFSKEVISQIANYINRK